MRSRYRRLGVEGSTTWLVLSCIIVGADFDHRLRDHRDYLLKFFAYGQTPRPALHFINLKHGQRIFGARHITKAARHIMKCSTVFAHKDSLEPATRESFQKDKDLFYWYLARYLIERISWCCDDSKSGIKSAKIVFSDRRNTPVKKCIEYLLKLKTQPTSIRWNVIDIEGVCAAPMTQLPGLQIADFIAGSFAAAIEPDVNGVLEPAYANILRPITYCSTDGNFLSYGVKGLYDEKKLTDEQKGFFDSYKNSRPPD
ncbi:MAG: DUF3800 domain-containing protein [Candidatus Hydrogenedentes bacterium]|nr:DUF3800 domain-containing protein [Candidatus Hydrogenedentota bacterium]